jgi:SH3 domain protein
MTNKLKITSYFSRASYSLFFSLLVTTFISACYSTTALAETKYVTDKIILELHKTQSNLSTLVTQLPSGTPLIILETDGAHSKVETPDKKTGWVETAYLMSSKPASLMYSELSNEHKKTLKLLAELQNQTSATSAQTNEDEKNVGWMRVEMKKARDKAKAMEDTLIKNNKKLDEALKSKARQDSKITDLQAKLDASINENQETLNELNELTIDDIEEEVFIKTNGLNTEIPLLWFLIGIGVVLIGGLIAGAMMLDVHNRKKHGGFRI